MNIKVFLLIALEAVIGVLMSAVLLLPSVIMVMSNNRIGSYLTGWSGVLYNEYQRYGYIFQCFFFPPDLPARPVFFPDADAKWSSVAGWLPLFGMTGVITYFLGKKGTWLKRILLISIVFAFIPILNASFSAFNYAYYARWFYMPILMMCLATARCLEDKTVNWSKGWIWSLLITLAIVVLIGIFPRGQYSDGSFSGFGLYNSNYPDRFWITCGIAVLSLVIFGLMLILKKKSVRKFTVCSILVLCIISVSYGSYFIYNGKQSSYDTKGFIIPRLLEPEETIMLDGKPINEVDDQRIDVFNGMDNTAMFFGCSSINAFHSVVSRSIFDYYDFVGVERVVGSRPEANDKNYALRSFLSVKYLFDYTDDASKFVDSNGTAKMTGYKLSSTQNGYDIYENQYYIPYGFTYDYYVTESYCQKLSNAERQQIMLEAMVIPDDSVDKYSSTLKDIRTKVFDNENTPTLNSGALASSADSNDSSSELNKDELLGATVSVMTPEEKEEKLNSYKFKFTIKTYQKACKERAASAALTFDTLNDGFESVTKLDKDNYVFFSIPYDEGWSATVDGKPVDIEKVNVGFMAVKVDGDGQAHTIKFTYTTPGLKLGLIISILMLLVWLVYLLIGIAYNKKHPVKKLSSNALHGNLPEHNDVTDGQNTGEVPDADVPIDGTDTESAPFGNIEGIRPTSYKDEFIPKKEISDNFENGTQNSNDILDDSFKIIGDITQNNKDDNK